MTSSVMARVYIVKVLRLFITPFTLELVAFSTFFTITLFMISIQSVIANAMQHHSMTEYAVYMAQAFVNTQLVVKVLCLGIGVAGFFVLQKILIKFPYRTFCYFRSRVMN